MVSTRRLLLSWQEPEEIARLRREDGGDGWPRLLLIAGVTSVVALTAGAAIGGWEGDARGWFFAVSVAVAVTGMVATLKKGKPRQVRLSAVAGGPRATWAMPLLAFVGRHPRRPQYRALCFVDCGGTATFMVGIPETISDEAITQAWRASLYGTVPIRFVAEVLPWPREGSREGALFWWPDGPSGWPLSPVKRQRLKSVYPMLIGFLPSAVLVPPLGLSLGIGLIALWAVGRVTSWNDNSILAAPSDLILSAASQPTVCIPWRDLHSVSLFISPYASEKEGIAVEYDREGERVEFAMRFKSRRFEYERFVQALSTKTDAVAEVVEAPEGIRIRVTGFERRAAEGGKEE